MNRYQAKPKLRLLGEAAVKLILGRSVPRHDVRRAGRVYANEAYRVLTNRPVIKVVSPNVIMWIVKEFNRLGELNAQLAQK